MPYKATKVYYDGSHYIAIPYEPRPKRRKPLRGITAEIINDNESENESGKEQDKPLESSLKAEFENYYKENANKRKCEKIENIVAGMRPYFENESDTKSFVAIHIARKKKNAVVRKMRLARKVNLKEFNYFCTFTYDDKKHTEETFKRKLSDCFLFAVCAAIQL